MHRMDLFEKVLVREAAAQGQWGLVHVWWQWKAQAEAGWLVQVYVDGALMEVGGVDGERSVWLWLDRSVERRVRLVAVAKDEPWALLGAGKGSDEMDAAVGFVGQPALEDAARVGLVRDTALPVDTRMRVLVDGERVSDRWLWDGRSGRSGFGGLFGEGGFGTDAATGPGLGGGELGMGPLGADGQAWRWRSEGVMRGEHLLEVEARTASGLVMDERAVAVEAVGLSSDWEGRLQVGGVVFER